MRDIAEFDNVSVILTQIGITPINYRILFIVIIRITSCKTKMLKATANEIID